jgi:hypothetical protein
VSEAGGRNGLRGPPWWDAEVWRVGLPGALPPVAAYAATLHPSVPAGDSGELIAVASTLGVAHPPGYPLYALAGHAWLRLLPAGGVAWRLNLLSAICAAAAAAFLALAVRRLGGSRWGALAGAWTFAFAAPTWKVAVVAEAFAPNALLAALALWAFAAVLERAEVPSDPPGSAPPRWPLPLLAFLSTVLLSHHHTLVLLLAPLLLVVLLLQAGRGAPRAGMARRRPFDLARGDLLRIGLAAAAGLLPLLHLPLAASSDRALVWGETDTLRGFLRHLLRADYGTFQLDPMASRLLPEPGHGLAFLASLPGALGIPGLLLGLLGIAAAARRRALAAGFAGFALLQGLFFTRIGFPLAEPLFRGVVERFHVLPLVVIALLAGLGATALEAAAVRRAGSPARRAWARWLGPAVAAAALAWPLASNAGLASQRGNRFAENLGRGILASLPQGAVLFTRGDVQRHALEFLTRVEGLRPDVAVVDQELLTYDWSVRRLRRLEPDLLPPLGRGERIHLANGRVLEGLAVPRPGGLVALLLEDGELLAAAREVLSVEPVADPSSLFRRSRSRLRYQWPVLPSEDRYSGLPGTRNLLWLDHLAGRRPVAFVGTNDESWQLGYELVPSGLVERAFPAGGAPGPLERARLALDPLASVALDDYFLPWDPTSFEAAERARLAEAAAAAARTLCHPEARGAGAGTEGRRRLLEFAARLEDLGPPPDPDALLAVGLLRLCDPEFGSPARARADLERYLATGPRGPGEAQARRALERLGGR